MIVGQTGRLMFEAVLFAASLRASDPDFAGRLIVAEPQPGPLWSGDPRIRDAEVRAILVELGAEILPFENRVFGEDYPIGNKAEGLTTLPKGEPFVFFDTDTLVTGALSHVPFPFYRPAASMRREGTWPKVELYGPTMTETWAALYAMAGLDFETSLDPSQPDGHWERYLYFNAGWFFGPCPHEFGSRLTSMMQRIRDTPPPELVCQEIYPWLDQIALPLVIHGLGGGRPGPALDGLDGPVTCHWRTLPLLYARENADVIATLETVTAPNRIKKVLKRSEAFKRLVFQGKGARVRALFDRSDMPRREQVIRNRIKRERLWIR
ncbi:MAG: hypothetical protein AAFR35_11705 [Pseudomonadota bacterium]